MKLSRRAAKPLRRGALLIVLAAFSSFAFLGCSKKLRWPWSSKPRKTSREHARVEKSSRAPRLAIIIDDLGNDPAEAESVLALPFPLTASVLPHHQYSAQTADEAWRRGDQVILHLPMQPLVDVVKPEAIELRVGMSASQVQSDLAGMLATVPHAIGVNNHEGSRATANPQLMAKLMLLLRARGLFFIDSRTTAATVAYDAAERAGVRAASRKVFLDDTPTREAVLAQLDLAARDAIRDGSAIAIGHPHPETIAALAEGVPQLEKRGIHVVFASELVR
ncbi:MAG: divergent polysaccharide deacetylase family protein [Candidatus Acidiferrales bacterium]